MTTAVIDLNDKPTIADTVIVCNTISSNRVEKDPDVDDDLTKLKSTVTHTLPLASNDKKLSLIKILCGSSITLIVLAIVSVIPLLQLIIGWRYADECPVNWRIPHYLIVGGAVGFIAIIAAIFQALLALCIKPKMNETDLSTPTIVAACGLCGISIILFFIIIFLIGWFIAGCIWVFRVWNKVQYRNSERLDYCNPILYRFAYWLLFISILYHLFTLIRSCCPVRQQLMNNRKNNAIPVPTTEP
ncbi:unnamed protein product [Adineta steineri]|uniref:Uncharacterized protein n=1 Tax=Adineta steineri TaxID=433720 RepID=A0A815ZGZ4_9BILA|nr:unnamed protein product [Adineta steineri]CAF1584983.1 unnamed protein product [Adineta steineri]